jgi:hypothetical protein
MAGKSQRTQREREIWRALLSYAIVRPESAVVLGLTIVLGGLSLIFRWQPFPFWRWWYWLILGLLAEVGIVYTTLTDQSAGALVMRDLFRQEYNSREIRDPKLRRQLERALDYRDRIEEVIQKSETGIMREHLLDTTTGLDDWLGNIFELSLRLDTYQGDPVISQDREAVPLAIQNLQAKLKLEDDESVRDTIRHALDQKRAQWTVLERLDNAMDKATFQLESTLTALGTVYSQVLLIGARGVEGGRAKRLRQDITDQVQGLQDVADSLDQAYQPTGPADIASMSVEQLKRLADEGEKRLGGQVSGRS